MSDCPLVQNPLVESCMGDNEDVAIRGDRNVNVNIARRVQIDYEDEIATGRDWTKKADYSGCVDYVGHIGTGADATEVDFLENYDYRAMDS